MKKILVLFVLTAIAMVSVNAQDNLKWGVMAGMNVSKYTFTGFDNRVGFIWRYRCMLVINML